MNTDLHDALSVSCGLGNHDCCFGMSEDYRVCSCICHKEPLTASLGDS